MSNGTPNGPSEPNPFGVGGGSGGSSDGAPYQPTRPLRGSGSPFDDSNPTEPLGPRGSRSAYPPASPGADGGQRTAPAGEHWATNGAGVAGSPGATSTVPDSAGGSRPKRRRGLVVAGTCLLGAAVLVVGADFAARAITEAEIAKAVERDLPTGVAGGVSAQVGGVSALWQLATGRFEHVSVAGDGLTVLDVPVQARVDLYDLSFRGEASATSATATASIPESLVNRAAELPGGGWVSLGDGEASYRLDGTWLGATGSAEVFARPSVDATGRVVTLKPERAALTATVFGQQLSVEPPLDALPGVDVCAAQYLPQGVTITAATVSPGSAELSLSARDVPFTSQWADSRGSCG